MSDIVHAREQDRSEGLFTVWEALTFHERLSSIGMEPEPRCRLRRTRAA